METVLDELVKRAVGDASANPADACAALRKLRAAFRKSDRIVDAAARMKVFDQLYFDDGAASSNTDHRRQATGKPSSSGPSETLALERLFTLVTFVERRAATGSSLDGHTTGTDPAHIVRRLANSVMAHVATVAESLSQSPHHEPLSNDQLTAAAVAMQCAYACTAFAFGKPERSVWLALIGAMELHELPLAVGDVADRLRASLEAGRHSTGRATPLVAVALAITLRVVSAIANCHPPVTCEGGNDVERLGPLAASLAGRLLGSGVLPRVATACAFDSRVSIAANDALVDMLAAHGAAVATGSRRGLPIDLAALDAAAPPLLRAALRHLAFTAEGPVARKDRANACVEEGKSALVAAAACSSVLDAEAADGTSSASHDLGDVLGTIGPLGVQTFSAALGEWHTAVTSAYVARGCASDAPDSISLEVSLATEEQQDLANDDEDDDGAPKQAFFVSRVMRLGPRCPKAEVQVRVRASSSSRAARVASCVGVHQWAAAHSAADGSSNSTSKPTTQLFPDPRDLEGYIGVYGEVAAHAGQVNHSKPVARTICRLAQVPRHASQVASDASVSAPPKGAALSRSLWATALSMAEPVSLWAYDVQVHLPSFGARRSAPQVTSVVVVSAAAIGDANAVDILPGNDFSLSSSAATSSQSPVPTVERQQPFRVAGEQAPATTPRHTTDRSLLRASVAYTFDDEDDDFVMSPTAVGNSGRNHTSGDLVDPDDVDSSAAGAETSLLEALANNDSLARPGGAAPTSSSQLHARQEQRNSNQRADDKPMGGEGTHTASPVAPPPPTELETVTAELEAAKAERDALRHTVAKVTHQRDEATSAANAARHELTVQETTVVEPLMAEVTELRRLVSRYHAAMEAAALAVQKSAVDATAGEAEAQRCHGAVRALYERAGLDL